MNVVVRIRPPVRKDERVGELSESLQYDKEKNMLFLLSKDEDNVNTKQYAFDRAPATARSPWSTRGASTVPYPAPPARPSQACFGKIRCRTMHGRLRAGASSSR